MRTDRDGALATPEDAEWGCGPCVFDGDESDHTCGAEPTPESAENTNPKENR